MYRDNVLKSSDVYLVPRGGGHCAASLGSHIPTQPWDSSWLWEIDLHPHVVPCVLSTLETMGKRGDQAWSSLHPEALTQSL